jgi:hypothetical protein
LNTGIRIIGKKKVKPSTNIVEVFRNAGYALPAAVADLVDNSIDAGAKNVLVRFVRTASSLDLLEVIDDGHGMTEEEVDEAMRFGTEREREEDELGMYGVGLKSASLSSCDSLTVISRSKKKGAKPIGRQWTPEGARSDWTLFILDPEECRQALRETNTPQVGCTTSGTVIRWEEVHDFSKATNRKEVDQYLKNRFKELRTHLGLHFHRIIKDGGTTIHLDSFNTDLNQLGPTETVKPLDPFGYRSTGSLGYKKKFILSDPETGDLELVAHIWPKGSKLPEYKLDGVANRQGLYFYRNDRLIHGGGWGGSREDAEPHLNLARVAIDLPREWQSEIRVYFNKSGVSVPSSFPDALRAAKSEKGKTTWAQYVETSRAEYRRKAAAPSVKAVTAPGKGVPYAVKKEIRNQFPIKPIREVVIAWKDLPEAEFFLIDNKQNKLEISLTLNNRFRDQILAGRPKTVSDAPLLRTLLYLLLQEQFDRKKVSAKDLHYLEALNRILRTAAKEE